MREKEVKELCKFVLDNGHRRFSDRDRQLLKMAIDNSNNLQELFAVAMASALFDLNKNP